MSAPEEKFDPQLLQARWVLGGINAADLPQYAVLALQQGFDCTALRQLAGLVKPTRADLEGLPDKVFLQLGLKPMEREQAVSFLIARGIPPVTPTIATLLKSFPEISDRWKEHIAFWGGEKGGDYLDMAEFVHFVVEDLYESGKRDEVARFFQLLEDLLSDADEDVNNLIALGFFETLQNFASWRPYGNKVFQEFLGPKSKEIWKQIERIWAGKNSLADVIRAEREK